MLRRGIIPARAGFTSRSRTTSSSVRDHPRSRGVYCRPRRWRPLSTGSSPLARGLRSAPEMILGVRRIIPARAGFTYSLFLCSPHSGSSPLARGLPHGPYSFSQWAGIIPARAGFTTPGPGVRGCTGDHPRSRGVYTHTYTVRAVVPGSSPLARGLPQRRHRLPGRSRIIPARAGFTLRGGRCCSRARDHPRSRGVYGGLHRGETGAVGSSPLARGLPRARCKPRWRSRIIPARAGFTRRSTARTRACTDHPRSRGVYLRS